MKKKIYFLSTLVFLCFIKLNLSAQDKANIQNTGLTFDKQCYYINGKPAILIAGEIEYFRVPKKDWKTRLTLFKEAGGNCVSIYIPWILHEPIEGQFVFGGNDGVTDLEGFLNCCKEFGLFVIARPGPFVYAELKYGGVPAWLIKNYPEINAKNIDGSDFNNKSMLPSISYNHPVFLNKAEKWMNHVCLILNKYTQDKNGPIVCVQLDNETDGLHLWYGGLDYNKEGMGIGTNDGRYPTFLRNKYNNIEELNKAYESSFADFSSVRPVNTGSAGKLSELRNSKDYSDFYFSTIAQYFQFLANIIRKNGIQVPLSHNSWPFANSHYYEATKVLGSSFILGNDHYYNLDQTWTQNNPTPQYSINVFSSLETLRVMGFPPTVYEMAAGSYSDWPPLGIEDFEANVFTNIAWGLKGLNYYIFTGGPNPEGMGSTSLVYDFGAPIGPNGEVRPLYQSIKKIGKFLNEHEWIANAKRQFDCRVAFNYQMQRADVFCKSSVNQIITDNLVYEFLKKGILSSMFCAGISPAYFNLENNDWINDVSTPIVVASSSSMQAEYQMRIVNFLKNGGKVLLTPVIPVLDENFNSCTILSDYIGKPSITQNIASEPSITIGKTKNIYNSGEIFITEKLPEGAEILGKDENNKQTIAWKVKTTGGGQLAFLGFRWIHGNNEHQAMISEIMNGLGLTQIITNSNPNIWVSVISNGDKSTLFVMNLFVSKQITNISYGEKVWNNIEVPGITVKTFDF